MSAARATRNSLLCRLAAHRARALLVELGHCRLELAGRSLDLVLELADRDSWSCSVMRLNSWASAPARRRSQYVDPLIQRSASDSRPQRPASPRSARPSGERATLVPIARARNRMRRSAVRRIVESVAPKCLAQRLLDEDPPSGSTVWNALSTSRPSGSRPTVTELTRSRVAPSSAAAPAGARRSSFASGRGSSPGARRAARESIAYPYPAAPTRWSARSRRPRTAGRPRR